MDLSTMLHWKYLAPIATVIAALNDASVISVLPHTAGIVVTALGGLLTLFGIHSSINNPTPAAPTV